MNKRIKTSVVISIVIILGIGGWWFWNLRGEKIECSEITSMLNIEKCLGERIEAVGILECEKPGVPPKAGVNYLKFENGTELRFLEEYPNCESYDGQKARVIGEFYQCGELDQCAGTGLRNIESVNLISGVPKQELTVATDKTEYEQGETIKITIKNDLNKSIWYVKELCPPSCCNLYKWENNEWKNLGDPMPCVQLTPPPSGKSYHFEADELKPEENITKQWNMKIATSFAESGKYRFSFYYGLSKESYTEKTIYSNEFTIKKETGILTPPKSCDLYEMPMTEEEIRECICPDGYKKFYRLSGTYCATDSRKPCSAHADCPKGEHCISTDRKNWFCTGQFAGCYYRNPENLEEPMLCAD